ncbi:GTP-binding protein [Faecalibaculum rodentium]|uniref:GTP-binding protein n=1 Tax=Faecalibaculum rodentium TaxID=1702221 RepID=UPI003F662897
MLNALLGPRKPSVPISPIQRETTLPGSDRAGYTVCVPGYAGDTQTAAAARRVLNKNAYNAMDDADAVAWIVDVTQNFGPGDEFVLDRIRNLHKPVILLVNKVDLVPKEKLLRKLLDWQEKFEFSDIVPVSAKDG